MAGGSQGRLVGVGFLVGAKDDGASETFDNVAESADRTADAAEDAGERGGRGVGMLKRALEGIASVNLANISSTLDSIADRAGTGVGAQATSLEQHSAQFNQTARLAEARLGSMGGALRAHRGEVSSLAYAYGVSGDELFNFMAPLSRVGIDIEDLGVSTRGLAGHIQAGTINAESMGAAMAELATTYELGAEGAGSILNQVMALGDEFGTTAASAQAFPGIMDTIRAAAARFPVIAEDVEGVSMSIVGLGNAMSNLGMDPSRAFTAAQATFSALAESRGALTDLITGVGSALPDMATQLGIATSDIGGSIESILEDPLTFAANMGIAMREVGESTVMGQRLVRTLGEISPELLQVARDASQGGDAIARVQEPLENVEGAFDRAGRAALTSTLTFSDQLERMRDSYTTRLNSIGRATDTGFVQRQADAYKRVGDRIEDFAGRSGPLGALTRGFLRVRTFGLVQGLIPGLGALGEGLGDTAEAAGPVMRVMGDTGLTKSFSGLFQAGGRLAGVTRILGTTFLGVLGPIALVAGAGYLLYRNWDKLGEMWRGLGDSIDDLSVKFQNWVDRIDWQDMGDRVVSGVIAFFDRIGSASEEEAPNTAGKIADAFKSMFESAAYMVGGLAVGMWDRIIEWITNPPNIAAQVTRGAQALGAMVGSVLGIGMLTPLRKNIVSAFGRLFGGFGDIMTGGRGIMGGAGTALRRIPYVGAIIGVLMDLPQIIQGFQTGGIITGLRELFESVVDGLLMGIPSLVGRLTGTENIVESIFDFLFEGLNIANIQEAIDGGEIGRAILESLMAISGGGFGRMAWNTIFGEGAGDAIMTGMGGVMEAIGSIFTEVASAYTTVVGPVWDALQEAGGEIMAIFGQLWSDTLQPLFNDIWGAVSPVTEVFDDMGNKVDDIAGAFDNAEGGVRGFAEMAGDFIRNNVAPAIIWLAENAIPLVVSAVEIWADRLRGLVDFWRSAWPTIETVFGHIQEGFSVIGDAITFWWENVASPIIDMWVSVWDGAVEHVFPLVEEGFKIIGDAVTWWWDSVTMPVLRELRGFFTFVMDIIEAAGRWVFNALGEHVTWWWENVTRPVFNTLRVFFSAVVTDIMDAGRFAFDFLATHITSKIEQAAVSFEILRTSWDLVKNVLSTGFQEIGAKIQRFLTIPFIRLTGTIVGMVDMIRLAFIGVKEEILGMFLTIMQGFRSLVADSGIPFAGTIASALDDPIAAIEGRISGITNQETGERAVLQRQINAENARRQGEIDTRNAEVDALEERRLAAQAALNDAGANIQTQRRQESEQRAAIVAAAAIADERAAEQRTREAQQEREDADARRQQARAGRITDREIAAAATEEERVALTAARAETDERRATEAAAAARRGGGARRAAQRSGPSAADIASGLAEAMASGPGSSSNNPNHVVVDGVSPNAQTTQPRTIPHQLPDLEG